MTRIYEADYFGKTVKISGDVSDAYLVWKAARKQLKVPFYKEDFMGFGYIENDGSYVELEM